MLNDIPQWVAIYTNPRGEKKANQRLQDLGFETYLPLQRKVHRWSDRWKRVEVPLFPSYLFVKIRITDVERIRGAEGVAYIVSWKNQPAVTPESEIDAIRRLMEAEEKVYVTNETDLKKGAQVRIVGGPYSGMEGTLVSNCQEGNFGISISGLNFVLVMQIEKDLLVPIGKEKSPRKKGLFEKMLSLFF